MKQTANVNALKLLGLAGVILWQVYNVVSLSWYATELSQSLDRHVHLQGSLRDATGMLQQLRNSTQDCEAERRERANEMSAARQTQDNLKLRLEQLEEENAWLNQTVAAKEAALSTEQARRMQLEGSVQSLKEQMNLMQGQLLTAQQQQGVLHGGKKHHH
mmetsp:Transcript_55719/g.121324  ORF Transcript_55719/g.121324 Transcript_55719/m.121324 type:complete len:160 (-) Transcript_55719:549-1028(-)